MKVNKDRYIYYPLCGLVMALAGCAIYAVMHWNEVIPYIINLFK